MLRARCGGQEYSWGNLLIAVNGFVAGIAEFARMPATQKI